MNNEYIVEWVKGFPEHPTNRQILSSRHRVPVAGEQIVVPLQNKGKTQLHLFEVSMVRWGVPYFDQATVFVRHMGPLIQEGS